MSCVHGDSFRNTADMIVFNITSSLTGLPEANTDVCRYGYEQEEFGKWKKKGFIDVNENDELLVSEWVQGLNLHNVLNATPETTTLENERDSVYDIEGDVWVTGFQNGLLRKSHIEKHKMKYG